MKEFGYNVIFLLEECHPNTIDDIDNKIEEERNKKKDVINKVLNLNTDYAKAHNNVYKEKIMFLLLYLTSLSNNKI